MNHVNQPLTGAAARLLTVPTEPWLSCEDCFELMDAYVEDLLAGSVGTGTEPMRVHLRACGACAEEAESRLGLVAEQDGVDPVPALRRMRADPA